jgi:hypothetical protein
MKKAAFFFLVMLLSGLTSLAQDNWFLKSAEEDAPVPYAKVTEIRSQQWTSSDNKGEFNLDVTLFPNDARFSISAMGYADTIVSLEVLKSSKQLLLKPHFVELEEHVVLSEALKRQVVGDYDLPLSLSKSGSRKHDPNTSHRYAVYVDLSGKGAKILSSLSFYLAEGGDPDPRFTVRVLVSDEVKTPKKGQIYRISQFKDIKVRSHSLHEAKGYGWSTIDLSTDEIVIPDKYKGAFLIFDVMDEGEGTQKSMVIPFQDQSREKLNAGFYQTSGVLGIYNKNRDHFAVVLEYLTE